MKRVAKDYGWPHMFYCKADGTYLKCATLADVPKGFVDTRGECDIPAIGEPTPYMGERPATAEEEVVETAGDEDNKPPVKDEDGETITLKSLGISRKEAISALEEEKIDFNPKAKNNVLASLVHALLSEAEDGDEDEDETEE